MIKNALLKKTVCLTTILAFSMANLPKTAGAYGYRLTPESFNAMYSLAQSGEVEALRASVNRGLNIDVMNADGDTGLCVAARRHDSYTYNSFRAAGANPRHPCTQNIDDYEEFVNSSRTVPVNSTAREAYGTIGKESYSISPKVWWWLGGAALVGGVLAIALGGGGGGGSGGESDSGGGSGGSAEKEEYNSLGANSGSEGSVRYKSNNRTRENYTDIKYSNSNSDKIKNINLISSVLKNTEYMDVVLSALNSGKYNNMVDTVLQIGEGTIAMSATNKSSVNNYGFINIDSYNASIGMVASEGSSAANYGKGIISEGAVSSNNGISMNFSGSSESDTIVGMYADTNSTLHNFGDIKGTAIASYTQSESEGDRGGLVDPEAGKGDSGGSIVSSPAANGTLIGMQAMIVNSGKDLSKDATKVYNESTGNINLSAGDAGASGGEIKVSLVGMGSFLDDGFLNGSKNISRAESVSLYNSGNITLSYTGNYTPSTGDSLRKGTGGIIGMRADANTYAYNTKNINIYLDDYSSGNSNVDVAAGMQSVHGGNLDNSGTINIVTSAENQRKNYGMLSVEGSGTVSGLYTNLNQKLKNSGTINVQASNSFGMASFNGGELTNTGNITIGKSETSTKYSRNIAMYASGNSREAKMENTGTIDIYSHDSIAMQNDFAGGTTIYNRGTINIYEDAYNSRVFGGSYSEAYNSGTVNYYANSSGNASTEGTTNNPFANHANSIGNSIMSTKGDSFMNNASGEGSSSNTEAIYNDYGAKINMFGSSHVAAMTVEAVSSGQTQGKAYNNGLININNRDYENVTNAVGMYLTEDTLDNALIENNGTINTDTVFSAAMASSSTNNARMVNNGNINGSSYYSLGMYSSGWSNIENNGQIRITGDKSAGILISSNSAKSRLRTSSDSLISIGTKGANVYDAYGIYITDGSLARVENNGVIDMYTSYDAGGTAGAGIYSLGSDVNINNNNKINIYGNYTHGIYAEGTAEIINDTDGKINVGSSENPVSGSHGIYSKANGSILNRGYINIFSKGTSDVYGIYSEAAEKITNNGYITINSTSTNKTYGIYSTGDSNIANGCFISMNNNNSTAIYSAPNENVYIENTGKIIVNGDYSYGIHVVVPSEETNVKIVNTGIFNINGSESHAVYLEKLYEQSEDGKEDNVLVSGVNDIYIVHLVSKFSLPKNVRFINQGEFSVNGNINFGSEADNSSFAYIGRNGSYEANSFSGTAMADSSLVLGGFDKVYVGENSFIGRDNGLSIVSKSYLFDADLRKNTQGNIDVVMTMASFADKVENEQMVDFFTQNYEEKRGENIFDVLKTAENKVEFEDFSNKELGFSFVPNLAKESLDIEKNVNFELNNDLLENTKEISRHKVSVLTYRSDIDNKDNVSGYKDSVIAAYGYSDWAITNGIRAGFAIAAVRADSDFDDGSNRHNNVLEAAIPVIFSHNNTSALFKPKAGFGRGKYHRSGVYQKYKANVNELYYGFDSAARHNFDLDVVAVEPNIGFNLTNLHFDSIKEKNDGLRIKSGNTISALSYVGTDIKKKFALDKESAILLSFGGKYFHEFGSKYKNKVTASDMIGYYDINSNRLQRNYGLLSLKAIYDYNNLSLAVSANMPIESKHNMYYLLNMGYKF